MTRQEFNEDINYFWQLMDFCYDVGCDYCDDLYRWDDYCERISDELIDNTRNNAWIEVRDWLNELPGDAYDVFKYSVEYNEWTGMYDDDDDFEVRKEDVYEWCVDHDIFDEEEEEAHNDETNDENDVLFFDDEDDHIEEVEEDDGFFEANSDYISCAAFDDLFVESLDALSKIKLEIDERVARDNAELEAAKAAQEEAEDAEMNELMSGFNLF